ncbi:MAG: aldehyde dehydrogenase family protein, partial [Pirellulales bacterium]|nr:aldehyde dehydrogenase family protein [Pirellulales bacterium]
MKPSSPLQVIDPATGHLTRTHPALDAAEVDFRIEAAHNAFIAWRHAPYAERADVLLAAAERLLAGKDRYAARITAEMGKPIT